MQLIIMLICIIIDVMFYVVNILRIKEAKTHRIPLFILVLINYIICNNIVRYNLYLYLVFDILIYFILKLLYKSKINDFFLVIFLDVLFFICSGLCYIVPNMYEVTAVVNKLLLILIMLFSNKFSKVYKAYTLMWDRHREKKMPLKSITLRNISLTVLNIFIVTIYFVLLYLLSKV